MSTLLACDLSLQADADTPRAKSPRVLTLAPFYPSQENPAQGCFIAEPLNELAGCGIKTQVIAVQPWHRHSVRRLPSDPPSRWESYLCLPGNLGLASAGQFLARKLLRTLRDSSADARPDLIHAHAALPCGHAAMIIAKQLGIPYLVSVHGLDAFSTVQVRGAAGKWCKAVSREVYRRAQHVICISEKVRQQVDAELLARTVVVYNGVDPQRFRPGCDATPLAVLSVGNLITVKGHALLLRAFARMSSGMRDCVLQVIGEGPEENALRALARDLGVGSRVTFLSKQTREQVAVAMQRCAVFALPSRFEGLGCVYLEAMASAKPVIARQGQGIGEIIEHQKNGLLISADSEPELAVHLETLISDHQFRMRLGDRARATVLGAYTLSHQAARLAEIYREIAE